MIKKILFGISFLLSVNAIYAQKIKIKKEEVRVDDVPVLFRLPPLQVFSPAKKFVGQKTNKG